MGKIVFRTEKLNGQKCKFMYICGQFSLFNYIFPRAGKKNFNDIKGFVERVHFNILAQGFTKNKMHCNGVCV